MKSFQALSIANKMTCVFETCIFWNSEVCTYSKTSPKRNSNLGGGGWGLYVWGGVSVICGYGFVSEPGEQVFVSFFLSFFYVSSTCVSTFQFQINTNKIKQLLVEWRHIFSRSSNARTFFLTDWSIYMQINPDDSKLLRNLWFQVHFMSLFFCCFNFFLKGRRDLRPSDESIFFFITTGGVKEHSLQLQHQGQRAIPGGERLEYAVTRLFFSGNWQFPLQCRWSRRVILKHYWKHTYHITPNCAMKPSKTQSADFIRDLPKQYCPNKVSRTGKPTMGEVIIIFAYINIYIFFFNFSYMCELHIHHFYSILHFDCISDGKEPKQYLSRRVNQLCKQTRKQSRLPSLQKPMFPTTACGGRGRCLGELLSRKPSDVRTMRAEDGVGLEGGRKKKLRQGQRRRIPDSFFCCSAARRSCGADWSEM